MKRTLLSLLLLIASTVQMMAMSYEEARQRAWFLTDKMAYELNLTPEQYDRVYEINLDYLMSIRTASDCTGYYWSYRDSDLRFILFDWQYNLYRTLDYFFRPIRWIRSGWYYPVCDHYRYGYYYFDRPTIYVSYHGHGWRRRSHNDPSPYRNVHFSRGQGMRDHYHSSRPAHDNRPSYRPDHDRHPGEHANRTDRNDRPSQRPDANRPGNGNHEGNHHGGSQRPDNNGSYNSGNRPGQDRTDRGNNSRPSTRPSQGNSGQSGSRPSNNGSGSSRKNTRPSRNMSSGSSFGSRPSSGTQRSSSRTDKQGTTNRSTRTFGR